MWRRVGRVIMACVAALALAVPLLTHPGKAEGLALGGERLYLPVILGPFRLAGIYDCVEYEFGLIWTTDVITLHPNGDSTYAYTIDSVAIRRCDVLRADAAMPT